MSTATDTTDNASTNTTFENADEAFAHLQELVDQLPQMQAEGDKLSRARAAREIHALNRAYKGNHAMFSRFDRLANEAYDKEKQAREAGAPQEEIDRHVLDRLYYSSERGYKVGPMQNSEKALNEALADNGFASVDEAEAAVLPDEEFDQLVAKVEAYQADYADTLAICQSYEEEEGDEEE